MKIDIFNVSHGFCALVTCDNNNRLMIDCGHDGDRFCPSRHLTGIGCASLEGLIISNFDEDHISDLTNVALSKGISVLYRNDSISAAQLESIKRQTGPISGPMRTMLSMLGSHNQPLIIPPNYAGVELSFFRNAYPSFPDTNNLSLVTFLEYNGMCVLFPGDIEVAGWNALLLDPVFRSKLATVDVFVASHHGRSNGYNSTVFNYCSPQIIIISDKEIVHETQKQTYASHARGIPFSSSSGTTTRKVLTTRSDGDILIEKHHGNGFHITI